MINLIIDTREQLPYSFSERVGVVRAALTAGDYSVQGFENQIAIERKSLNDFVNTVIHSRERFYKELDKLTTYDHKLIIIEASLSDIINHKYTGNAHPSSVWGSLISIQTLNKIPIIPAGNRQIACRFVEDFLVKAHKEVTTRCQHLEKEKQKITLSNQSNQSTQSALSIPLNQSSDRMIPLTNQQAKRTKKNKEELLPGILEIPLPSKE